MKKIVKLSVVRENEERSCPYGLPISEACKSVGKFIDDMCPLEEVEDETERDLVETANKRILAFARGEDAGKCKFANVIFDNEKVECSFGDYAAGLGAAPINPGPMVNTYLDFGFFSVPFNSDYKHFNNYFFASEEQKTKKNGDGDE